MPEPGPSDPTGPAVQPGSVPSLPATGIAAPPLPRIPARKPKKPAVAHERGATGFLVSSLFWMAVVSATLACVIQMVRPPDDIPDVVGIDTAAAQETFTTLRDLVGSTKPVSWTVNGKAINQFLETTIQMKPGDAGLSAISARFQRAFVRLRSGSFALYIDQKFLDTHLYFGLELEPGVAGSGLEVTPTGGAIGRLPIHPALTPVFLRLFGPTITGLAQPLELLKTAKSVTITPNDATLQWPGTGKPTQP
ncbi:MAG: hypothetical protein M0Q93_04940 [Terrimicrobiaceae bacterium]|nr:hypothetical protein [Terrimicrobiaceae bacterium]